MNAKYDLKTIFIFVLAIALIISFLAGQKSSDNTYKDRIKDLETKTVLLKKENDSLNKVNIKL